MIILPILISILLAIFSWKVISLAYWSIKASRLIQNIPGPKPLPIVGNALIFNNCKNLDDGAAILLKLFKVYFHSSDKIMKFWLGPELFICLGNPQHIETVLSSEHALNKEVIYRHLRIIGSGVLSETHGEKWAELRKMANSFLTKKSIESSLDIFHEKAMKLVKVLDKKVENDEKFNIRNFIAKYTFDTMLVSNFGRDINEIENERSVPFEEVMENIVENLFKLSMQFPTCMSVEYSKMTSLGRDVLKNIKIYWNLLADTLEQRKYIMKDNKDESKKIIADLFIQKAEKDKLSREEIGKIAIDYFLAGTHSVTIMASTIILLLAIYPEHQEAVYKEQLEILGGDPEVAPTWEQLSKMTYLTRVFKEVIRHLTAPFILRSVTKDIDLGNYTIPSGSTVVICLYSLHRDPTIWSHPEEFYPDHFLPEESSKRPKNSYLPFSLGPRNCPGALYALALAKIITSSLVRKFEFKTDLKYEDLAFKFSLLIDISPGQIVKKIPRNVI